jgi:hypothetical protein
MDGQASHGVDQRTGEVVLIATDVGYLRDECGEALARLEKDGVREAGSVAIREDSPPAPRRVVEAVE